MQPQNTFVLRIWWEFGESERASTWRGRIEHLQSGEHVFFKDADEMLSFLGRFVPMKAAFSPPASEQEEE